MQNKESGLTVGELLITLATLIIAMLIWGSFNKGEGTKQSVHNSDLLLLLNNIYLNLHVLYILF